MPPWTKEPPLSNPWADLAQTDIGDKKYSELGTLTYEGADLLRFSSTAGWGYEDKEIKPWL